MSGKRVKNKMSISIFCIILFTAAYLYVTSDSYRLKMGNKHYDKGNYKSAVKYFSKIKEVGIETLLKKSKGEIGLKKYNEALKTLETIEERSLAENIGIDLIDFYYDKAICLEAYGKWDKFIELSDDYLKIPKRSEKNEMIEFYIIHAYNLYGKNDEAVEFIHKFIDEYDENENREYLIKLCKTLTDYYPEVFNERIRKYYEEMAKVKIKPHPESLYSIVKDMADKAFEVYDKLIYLEPDNMEHYFGKALMYGSLYNSEKAYDYLVTLKDLYGDNKDIIDILIDYGKFSDTVLNK